MKYYCNNLAPDDLRWELRAVKQRLSEQPDSKEYRERLAELNAMPIDSAGERP